MQLGGAALVVLGAFEVGDQVVEAPSGAARVAPGVVVGPVAADVDHRVRGRRSAQRAAAGKMDAPPVAMRLAAGRVVPVDGAVGERGHSQRNVDVVEGVRRAGLDEQHFDVRVFTQACCQDAAGRACAHDDVVVHASLPFEVAAGILHRATPGVKQA
jgi:hypothetical protein